MILRDYIAKYCRHNPDYAVRIKIRKDEGVFKKGEIIFRWSMTPTRGYHFWDKEGMYLGKNLQKQGAFTNQKEYFNIYQQEKVNPARLHKFEMEDDHE